MDSVNEALRPSLGSLLVGCHIAIFLQGVLFVQFYNYFTKYRNDRRATKCVVAGLVLLTTLKTCQSFAMLWITFVKSFGDPVTALDNFSTQWTLQGNPLMVAAAGSYVRAYFCFRLFVISEAWWTAALVVITELAALACIAVGIHILRVNPFTNSSTTSSSILLFYTLHFSLVFVGDLLLSLLTAFFLLRSRKRVLPQTEGFINALIRMTFQTATPPAICSLFSLVFSRLTASSMQLLIPAFNELIPNVYAVSMMWTLNYRDELRILSAAFPTSFGSCHFSKGIAGIVPAEEMELRVNQPNGVKVHTEVVTHVNMDEVGSSPKTLSIEEAF